jgi:NTE family protein
MPHNNVPSVQRALVFQGGGALAAYEAGVFQGLYDRIGSIEGFDKLFDIVVGTSSGAMNAAVLASYVMGKRNWKDSQYALNDFWERISTDTKEYFPTKNTFEYTTFPIATSFDQNQPRLLLIAVDVQESAVVTFDSYPKKDNIDIRESRYGKYSYEYGNYEYTISYPDGISLDHLMASCWLPVNYDYAKITDVNKLNKDNSSEVIRNFWNGGILSNTPLRELIHWHRDYWFRVKGKNLRDSRIPDLEVYIVDIRSTQLEIMPLGRYGALDKQENLLLNDRTEYDEKVAILVSDYMNLVREYINLAKEYNIPNEKIESILSIAAISKTRIGRVMTYGDLLNGRFNINVKRIKRMKDMEIFKTPLDFSEKNIKNLLVEGRKDAMMMMTKF